MNESRKSPWVLATVVLLFVVLAGLLVWGQRWMFLFFQSPKAMICVDPNHRGRAFLVAQQGGYHVGVYVPTHDASRKLIVLLAGFREFDAVWSGDGSLLAFESNGDYIFAYDFRSGQAIPTNKEVISERSDQLNAEELDRIKTLVRERGAPKYRTYCSPNETFVPVTYSEWEKFTGRR